MNVSKKTIVISVCLAILFWVGIFVLRKQSQIDEQNFFNRNLRAEFSKYDVLRRVFHLDFDGDRRALYLSRNKKIKLEIDSQEGVSYNKNSINSVVTRIKTNLNKDIEVVYSEEDISSTNLASGLYHFEKNFRDVDDSGEFVYLHVLILKKDSEKEHLLGTTVGAGAVVVYTEALKDFTSGYPKTYDSYFEGTLLHEIGHQLGLRHNTESQCLMNEYAEVDSMPQYFQENVLVEFCGYENNLIEQEKKRFN